MTLFLSFMNLFRNSRRTLAILFTIALGTGVLFSFQGFIHGVLTEYRESTIHSHYGHGQIYTKGYRETIFSKPWLHWVDNLAEVESYLTSHEAVEKVFPRINFPALLKKDNITVSGYGQGIQAAKEAGFFYELNVEDGKTLTAEENGILLGKGLAKALDVKPGESLELIVNATDGKVQNLNLIVTGIFHTGSLDFDNKMFRIQLDKTQKLLKTSSIELISIALRDGYDWENFAKTFERDFPNLEAVSFAVLDKVYYQHSVDWLNAQFYVIQIIILSIVLLGIFNSISASILERKQEIGNFRANGESVCDVLKLIVLEGLFLGVLGALLGIGLAFFVLKAFLDHGIMMPPGPGLTRPFYISFQFQWSMVFLTLGLTVASSALASFLAALRVAKMPIAEALRAH